MRQIMADTPLACVLAGIAIWLTIVAAIVFGASLDTRFIYTDF